MTPNSPKIKDKRNKGKGCGAREKRLARVILCTLDFKNPMRNTLPEARTQGDMVFKNPARYIERTSESPDVYLCAPPAPHLSKHDSLNMHPTYTVPLLLDFS